MDLVEQLYGDISLRDESLLNPVDNQQEEEEEIKNRDADELAWSRKEQEKAARRKRRSSTVSSAASVTSTTKSGRPSISSINRKSLNLDRSTTKLSSSSPSSTTTTAGSTSTTATATTTTATKKVAARPGGRSVQTRQVISLDDYAERMRMAAIMLAQLDASQTAARGVVQAGTAAAGTLVGLPVATVAGVGGLVGAGLGAGLGAVKARLGGRKEPVNGVGQASSGTKTSLDTASAAEGTSAVAGAPPLNAASAALSQSAAASSSSSSEHQSSGSPTFSSSGSMTTTTATTTTTTSAPAPTQRARVLAPQDAAAIRERIMSEMMALEEERMERMRGSVQARKGWSQTSGLGGTTDNAVVMRAVNKDDPSGEFPINPIPSIPPVLSSKVDRN
jgi:phosphatidylinositol 4-kinase